MKFAVCFMGILFLLRPSPAENRATSVDSLISFSPLSSCLPDGAESSLVFCWAEHPEGVLMLVRAIDGVTHDTIEFHLETGENRSKRFHLKGGISPSSPRAFVLPGIKEADVDFWETKIIVDLDLTK